MMIKLLKNAQVYSPAPMGKRISSSRGRKFS